MTKAQRAALKALVDEFGVEGVIHAIIEGASGVESKYWRGVHAQWVEESKRKVKMVTEVIERSAK